MLFTTGLGFFLFVNSQNLLYSKSLVSRTNDIQSSVGENLVVAGSTTLGNISFSVTNVGGVPSTVVGVIVINGSGYVLAYYNSTMGGLQPSLPLSLNPGSASVTLTTSAIYRSGENYTIKVITQLGNVFTAIYPPTNQDLAARALSSGAIGDLYLSFGSYAYYDVVSCGTSTSGYCLSSQGSAFTIPSSFMNANSAAFSVTVTDLNPNEENIVLDNYSLILQFWSSGGNNFKFSSWYIVSNQSININATTSPLTLQYDVPTVIVFGSCAPGSFQPLQFGTDCKVNGFKQAIPDNPPSPGSTAAVFIVSHGWLGYTINQITGSNPPVQNYGQNSPYVTTLYT